MHSIVVILALVSLPAFAAAQAIDPNTIPEETRNTWCDNQEEACPQLCTQQMGELDEPPINRCDPTTLDFQCICSSGQVPNATEYSQTIPYYLCTEANNLCVSRCNGVSTCASACRENNPCGAQEPERVNTSTVSTTTATSTSADSSATSSQSIYTTFGGTLPTNSAANGGNGGLVAMDMGASYSLALVLAGIFAGFALAL